MDVNLGCGHLSDDEFAAAFEECALSPAAFHHADHLRLAWIYAGRCDAAEAEEKLVAGIRRFATKAGVPEKFQYTTTVAWSRLVAASRKNSRAENKFGQWIASHPEFLDRRTSTTRKIHCVADVQFAAVVLAADPTAGIQSANHGSGLGSAAADHERDPNFLSGLRGAVSFTRISGVADVEGRGAPKNPGEDTTTSSRPVASVRSRSRSLGSLRIQKRAPKMYRSLRRRLGFLLPCKSFTLATREISAATLPPLPIPRLWSLSPQPEGPHPLALLPLMSELQGDMYRLASHTV